MDPPLVGVIILIGVRLDTAYGLTAAGSLLAAVAILAAALLATRSAALAGGLGRWAGRQATRVRSSVDPDRWASQSVDFRGYVARRFRRGLALSLPTLVGMLLVDALIVVLAIRFVGIGGGQLPWTKIVTAFLVVFPLTLFPLQGLGVLDAALVGALTAVGGVHLEAQLLAAMVTYRLVTLGTPAVLGARFILTWRRGTRSEERTGKLPHGGRHGVRGSHLGPAHSEANYGRGLRHPPRCNARPGVNIDPRVRRSGGWAQQGSNLRPPPCKFARRALKHRV